MNLSKNGGIEPSKFWQALSARSSPVAIVTTSDDAVPAGFLALSVTHLTRDPPTLMLSINNSTSALGSIKRSEKLAINYLRSPDKYLTEIFDGSGGVKGQKRFEYGDWTASITGTPILASALAAFDCTLIELIPRFDTNIAICRIEEFIDSKYNDPLTFFRGNYS